MRLHRVVSCLIASVVLATANVAQSTTGTWSPSTTRVLPFYPHTPYGLREHASVYDPKRNRVLVFGGISTSVTGSAACGPNDPDEWCYYKNELWALNVSSSPAWQAVPDCGPFPPCIRPSHRSRASMVYDPKLDRILVFGGYHPGIDAPEPIPEYSNGVLWELPLSQQSGWNPLPVDPGGPGMSEQDMDVRAVYDTARQRLLVIRPDQGVFAIGMSGGAWTQVYNHSLDGLIGGYGYGAVYDSNSDRLLIFGGRKIGSDLLGCRYDYFSNVYALSLVPGSTWQQIATGAPAVAEGAVVFDRDANRVLLYGGEYCREYLRGIQPIPLNPDLWELSLNVGGSTWQVVQPSGSPPPSRFAHSATLTLDRRLYVFGGTADGYTNFADTYKFQPTDPPIPEARARHVTVYDPIRQRMILWGGDDGYDLFKDDIWSMSLQPGTAPSWSKLDVTIPPEITTFGTRGAAAAFDTRRGVMYVHGGAPAMNTMPFGEFLQISFPDASKAVWSRPAIDGGILPGNRMFHSMAYDEVGDKLYLFGGWDGYEILGDTKQMTPAPEGVQWADVAVSPAPGARYGYVSYFDTKRRRFVVLGGEEYPAGGWWIGRPWALTVTGTPTWTQLNSGPSAPGSLWFGSAAYRVFDGNGAGNDQAYLTGGWFNPDNVWSNQGTWVHWLFDDPMSTGWSFLGLANAPSNHLYQHTSIFDRVGNRTIRFGGSQFAGEHQTHPYDTTPTNVMNLTYQLATPGRAYDSQWSQIALYGAGGGAGGGGGGGPKKQLTKSLTIADGASPRARLVVSGGLGSAHLRFQVDGARENKPLRVDIFDVQGRLLHTLTGLDTGKLTWNRRDRSGSEVAPGVYLYRAKSGRVLITGKALLTR